MYKWCHESRRNYTFVKLKATKISKRCVLFWSRGPDGYRKNDRKRAVVWPWLVLVLGTVLTLTTLGIRQSDWRRGGIRSTYLHFVVEWYFMMKNTHLQFIENNHKPTPPIFLTRRLGTHACSTLIWVMGQWYTNNCIWLSANSINANNMVSCYIQWR